MLRHASWHVEESGVGRAVPLLWEALRAAAMMPDPVWGASATSEEDLVTLWDALWQADAGAKPTLEGFRGNLPSSRLLDAARRVFLHSVQAEPDAIDSRDVTRALLALDGLSAAVDEEWDRRVPMQLPGPHALQLLAEAAHDMRSPLASILMLVDALRTEQSGAIGVEQRHQLGLIYSAAFELNALAGDLMDAAGGPDRVSASRRTPLSLLRILYTVRDILRPIAEQKGLELAIGAPDQEMRMGPPIALSRVLLNLAGNAVKFTPAGLVEVCARAVTETGVEFSVSDTGPGIPEPVLARLFEPIRRGPERDSVSFSRSGLGLLICRRLVTAMGGELRVESGAGGTRFCFALELPPIRGASAPGSVGLAAT